VIVARVSGGRTVLAAARATSPLRLIAPTFPGTTAASVCVVTFGGGLVDGDEIELELVVEAGATLVAFTQSSTKVFRGSAQQRISAKVDGTLVFLPDPVAAFAQAHYRQRVDVALGKDGACVLLDGFTSGRAAYGERWAMTALDLRTTVTYDGRAVVTDALRFDASDGPIAQRGGRFDAFMTLLAVGRAVEPVAATIHRQAIAPPSEDLVVAASALPRAQSLGLPGAVARVAAATPERALAAVRARLRNLPDIDAVDPFVSRYGAHAPLSP
jgi:urease accessory protein